METHHIVHPKGRVLAVDSTPASLLVLKNKLVALGHEVTVAVSAQEAREIFRRDGSGSFDCLITDCCMPEETGLDLLLWLKEHDPTLASIIMSRDANEGLLTRMLRCGASDFLEKPVMSEELKSSLVRTLDSTHRRRRHAATNSAVIEAGLVQRRMNDPRTVSASAAPLTICYHPCHEAGGDSVSFFPLDSGQLLIVVADVSGHNLKSAFISAYFQGMLRGLVEQRVPIRLILEQFNRFLVEEWNISAPGDGRVIPEIISLSVCAISLDRELGSMQLFNSGFPVTYRLGQSGKPRPCGDIGGNPLGWFDPIEIGNLTFPVDPGDHLVLWTDGLEDFAHQLDVDEWSLVFRLLQAKNAGESPVWLKEAPDDVLLIVVGSPGGAALPERFPIVSRSYVRADLSRIDMIQAHWQRSLALALPDLAPDRLADALLCCREGVLNALLHGCSNESDEASLTIAFDAVKCELEVEVIDPGPGYRTATSVGPSDSAPQGHCGLLLIHELPQRVELASCGAVVRMYFETPTAEREKL